MDERDALMDDSEDDSDAGFEAVRSPRGAPAGPSVASLPAKRARPSDAAETDARPPADVFDQGSLDSGVAVAAGPSAKSTPGGALLAPPASAAPAPGAALPGGASLARTSSKSRRIHQEDASTNQSDVSERGGAGATVSGELCAAKRPGTLCYGWDASTRRPYALSPADSQGPAKRSPGQGRAQQGRGSGHTRGEGRQEKLNRYFATTAALQGDGAREPGAARDGRGRLRESAGEREGGAGAGGAVRGPGDPAQRRGLREGEAASPVAAAAEGADGALARALAEVAALQAELRQVRAEAAQAAERAERAQREAAEGAAQAARAQREAEDAARSAEAGREREERARAAMRDLATALGRAEREASSLRLGHAKSHVGNVVCGRLGTRLMEEWEAGFEARGGGCNGDASTCEWMRVDEM